MTPLFIPTRDLYPNKTHTVRGTRRKLDQEKPSRIPILRGEAGRRLSIPRNQPRLEESEFC
jgi:hypothetical protein